MGKKTNWTYGEHLPVFPDSCPKPGQVVRIVSRQPWCCEEGLVLSRWCHVEQADGQVIGITFSNPNSVFKDIILWLQDNKWEARYNGDLIRHHERTIPVKIYVID